MAPTENQCDCTATPISPVALSRATIEYVATGRRSEIPCASSGAARSGIAPAAASATRANAFGVMADSMAGWEGVLLGADDAGLDDLHPVAFELIG